MYQAHDQADRAASPRPRGNRFVAGVVKRLGLMACALLLAPAAHAAIQVGAVTLPPGASIGMNMEAEVSVQWDRVAGDGDDVVRIQVNPAGRLTFEAAPGCTWTDPYYDCSVSGSTGTFTFPVKGATTGGFNITAVGRGSATTTQSVSGNVYNSGDLTVAKTLAVPALGNPLSGEQMRFDLVPSIALPLGMDLPVDGTITITDDLPGTAANGFLINTSGNTVAISGPVPADRRSCDAPADANASRTLTCTFTGPLTAAQINATTISIHGTSRSSGSFFNTAAIGASGEYVDSNPANNTVSVPYNVDEASDLTIRASANSPLGTSAARMSGNGSWAFSLRPINEGPLVAPAGSVVKTVLPADWTLDAPLPAGCSATPGGSLTLDAGNSGAGYNIPQHSSSQSGTWTGTLVTCTLPAQAQGNWPDIPLSGTLPNPATNIDGYIPMVVEVPPAPSTLRDYAPTNNGTTVRWHLAPEAADLQMWKSKSPALVELGGTRTSTMRVYNAGPAVATYSVANPVRVIDWLDPREIVDGQVTNVSAGWQCAVTPGSPAAGFPTQSTRVECHTTGDGTIPVNGSLAVAFSHLVTSDPLALGGASTSLTNRACTGSAAQALWSTGPVAGPVPADPEDDRESTGSNTAAGRGDCHAVSGTLTSVVTGNAQVAFQKEVAVSNAAGAIGAFQLARTADASAPLLAADADTVQWKMTITTPAVAANASQEVIPTLELRDTFQNLANYTTGTPNYRKTNPVATLVSVTGAPADSCPATINRSSSTSSVQMACDFTAVAPGSTIEVIYAVTRPFAQSATGFIANTATLSSPDAMLSAAAGNGSTVNGRVFSDTAHARVTPRADVTMSDKEITTDPGNGTSTNGRRLARVGEIVTFTLGARNNGIDTIPVGGFRISDDFPALDTALTPGYEVIEVVPANPGAMSCASNLVGNTYEVRCQNTAAIPRYQTQSIEVKARIVRPTGGYVPDGNYMYENVVNTATASLHDMCEFRSEGSSGFGGGANDSASCNDGVLGSGGAGALGNNQASVAFDVALPSFDLQQAKERLQGRAGDPPVLAGQTLRYRFGVYNRGPSRSQEVEIVDVVTLPPGGFDITIVGGAPQDVNAVNMNPGSTAAVRFNGTVNCAFEAAPAGTPENLKVMRCRLHADDAQNYLDGGESVSFVIEFQPQTPVGQNWGDFSTALTVSNTAYVCGDETNAYESDGECIHTRTGFPNLPEAELADAANNRAGVSNTVMPVTDLAVLSKTAEVNPADVGQSVPWTIVLRNNGASASTAMRVVDRLPAGFEWIPGDGSAAAPHPAVGTPTGGAVPAAPGGTLAVAVAPPAPDAPDVCYVSNGIATITAPGQRQEVTCHINGNFPAGSGYTLTLHAQPKLGVYAGPWLTDVLNEVSVEPGRDATDNPLSADNDPTNNDEDGPVQVRNAAAIGGRVFFDQNHNGDQNAPSDTAIAGVTVRLTGTDVHGNAIDLTTTTDASGDYRFAGLPPSDADGYTITQTQPAGYDNGTPQPNTPRTVRNGTSVGTTPAGADYVVTNTATTSVIGGVVLVNGADGVQFDFPEYNSVSLSGRVYEDVDLGDSWTPGVDAAIPNATVDLLVWDPVGGSYVFDRSVTTDGNGEYSFTGLDPALTYAVRQPVPTGFVDRPSATNPGLINGAACVAPSTCAASDGTAFGEPATTSMITGIVLDSGNGTEFNFGEMRPVSVSGRVFLDLDNDGVHDAPGEPGITGVRIELTGVDDLGNAVSAFVNTDSNGNFSFEGLRPGIYNLVEPNQPPGTANGITTAGTIAGVTSGTATPVTTVPSRITGIDLSVPGSASVENLFGEVMLPDPAASSISGKVWFDRDNDGVIDPDEEGIPGVQVRLVGMDVNGIAIDITISTDANGDYLFPGLAAGNYSVIEPDQPPGTRNGHTVPGSLGGTATTPDVTPSRISNIPLGPAQDSVDNNFGEIPDAIDLVVSKASSTAAFVVGEEASYTIRVRNIGHRDSTGRYVVEDRLPTGVVLAATPAGNGWTCSGNAGDGGFQCSSDAVLAAGATHPGEIEVRVEVLRAAANGGTLNNAVLVEGGGELPPTRPTQEERDAFSNDPDSLPVCDPAITQNACRVPATVSRLAPDLVVSKSVDADVLTVGKQAAYAISVRNQGKAASDGEYVVRDNLPAGVVLAGVPNGTDWICSGNAGDGGFSCASDVVLEVGAVHPGTISVPVQVLPEALAADEVNNAVIVAGGDEDPSTEPTPAEENGFSNDPGSLPVCDPAITQNACRVPSRVIRLSPDLVVSKSASTDVFIVGKQAAYAISVRNQGEAASDGEYVVRDNLPAGIVLASVPNGTDWICSGNAGDGGFSCASDVVLEVGAVHPGTISVSVQVLPEALAAGEVNNAVIVAGGGEDPSKEPTPGEEDGFGNDPGSLPVCDPAITQNACRVPNRVIEGSPDMVVSKSAETQVFTVGTEAAYVIRVRNVGNADSQGEYVVEDRLPFGIVLAGTPSGQGWSCTGSTGDSGFRCVSDVVVPEGELHPGVIRAVVQVLPAALGDAPVNNAVIVSGGDEDPEDEPTPEERDDFEKNPEDLPECDADVSQDACRVPNEVRPPEGTALLNIAKRGDRSVVEIGDIVLYTVDIRHAGGPGLPQVDLVDRLPHGFTYIDGTARVDGAAIADPAGRPGPVLVFDVGELPAGGQRSVTYRVRVGVGAAQGDGINRAQAHGCWSNNQCVDVDSKTPLPGSTPSNRAEYKVTIRGGVFAPEACVLGKVFVDCNNNHVQDEEELGIPGVRMYFSDGTWLVSDSEGKYSYCGLTPRSHTLKVDPSTLPVGSRLTTSSNRNLGDADSLFLDLKNGELHRADFIEGSCSNPVIEQVKARRTQGEVRAPETEAGRQPLRFESKPLRAPQQATDPANQLPIIEARPTATGVDDSQEVQP